MTIVTHAYRPKRARKHKAQAADMPVIVRAGKKAPVAATNGDDRKSAIVTAKNPRRGRFGDVPDMTPEEHKRRGDAADALFRELTRRVRDVGAWEPALATVARSCGQVGAKAHRSTDPLFRHAGLDLDHE